MLEIGFVTILVGALLLFSNRLAFKKDFVTDEVHVHKKTIAIVFSVLAVGLILIGFVLLFFKLF